MKTFDGFELQEGDECFVSIQDPMGIIRYSPNPRKAHYLDNDAKSNGWDFTIHGLDSDQEVEVVGVWKNKPTKKNEGETGK